MAGRLWAFSLRAGSREGLGDWRTGEKKAVIIMTSEVSGGTGNRG